jgi:hypothetical protein
MKREFLAAFKKLEKAAGGRKRYCSLDVSMNSMSKVLKYKAYIELPGPYFSFGGNVEDAYSPMEAVDLCIERFKKNLAKLQGEREER